MAKFKAPRGGKKSKSQRSGIPCVILIVLAFVFAFVLFYYMLKSA
jgi:hypothetical protein